MSSLAPPAPQVNNPSQAWLPFHGLAPAVKTSETSCEAARRIKGGANKLRARVLRWFIERGPAGGTDEEVQLALSMKTQTETPRRNELVKMGLLADSGRRRPTSSGRPATVWVVAIGGGAR